MYRRKLFMYVCVKWRCILEHYLPSILYSHVWLLIILNPGSSNDSVLQTVLLRCHHDERGLKSNEVCNEVIMVITVKIRVFWVVTPCSLLPSCQHSGWTFYTTIVFCSPHLTCFYQYDHITCHFLILVHTDHEEEGAVLPQNVIKRLPHNTVSHPKRQHWGIIWCFITNVSSYPIVATNCWILYHFVSASSVV